MFEHHHVICAFVEDNECFTSNNVLIASSIGKNNKATQDQGNKYVSSNADYLQISANAANVGIQATKAGYYVTVHVLVFQRAISCYAVGCICLQVPDNAVVLAPHSSQPPVLHPAQG